MAENPAVARKDKDGAPSVGSFSVSTAPNAGLIASTDDSVVVLGAGDTANSACFK